MIQSQTVLSGQLRKPRACESFRLLGAAGRAASSRTTLAQRFYLISTLPTPCARDGPPGPLLSTLAESRAKVFQRYCCRQFDDLYRCWTRHVLLQTLRPKRQRWRSLHPLSIAKHRLLAAIDVRTRLEDGEILQRLVRNTNLSPYGRVDIRVGVSDGSSCRAVDDERG